MAADLARTPTTGLKVQACGDCHLLNFGGFATPERSIIFDINDFDETLPAPWEWDVKRLVASIVLAARSNGLSDNHGRDCAVNCARMYREHMRRFSRMDPLRIWYTETSATDFINSLPKALQKTVKKRIEKTAAHSGSEYDFPKLAGSVGGQIRISDQPPLIFQRAPIESAPQQSSTGFSRATENRCPRTGAFLSIATGSWMSRSENHELVTEGIYRTVRHPMYSAFWLWAIAQALLLPNWIAGFAGLAGFAVLYFGRVAREERMMLETFGDSYRAYMARTGRVFPSITLK